jgi:hypothetical protein
VIAHPTALKLKHYIKNVTIRYTTDGTEPDSTRSSIYKDDSSVIINKNLTVKAKAYKPGWISSDIAQQIFYKAGYSPDSIQLINAPDPQYKGGGPSTLFDLKKGSLNFRDGKWLGFRQKKLEAIFYLNKPETISSVTISSLVDIASYLMPPQEIEVWGGNNVASLRLIKHIKPQQPSAEKPGYLISYDATFAPVNVKVLKVVVTPLSKLPPWHKGKKGEKGWAFVDEIFLN